MEDTWIISWWLSFFSVPLNDRDPQTLVSFSSRLDSRDAMTLNALICHLPIFYFWLYPFHWAPDSYVQPFGDHWSENWSPSQVQHAEHLDANSFLGHSPVIPAHPPAVHISVSRSTIHSIAQAPNSLLFFFICQSTCQKVLPAVTYLTYIVNSTSVHYLHGYNKPFYFPVELPRLSSFSYSSVYSPYTEYWATGIFCKQN